MAGGGRREAGEGQFSPERRHNRHNPTPSSILARRGSLVGTAALISPGTARRAQRGGRRRGGGSLAGLAGGDRRPSTACPLKFSGGNFKVGHRVHFRGLGRVACEHTR